MRVPIIGAAYAGRSVIASGQRCVNWYAESNKDDPQAPSPITYYQTPGSVLYSDPNFARTARGSYRTSKGTAYYVVGPNVYFLDSVQGLSLIGFIADRTSQVYFADNGLAVVLVDGVSGYAIDIVTNQFGVIIDPSFYGADYVVLLDTFFVFNRPATNQFYISLSNVDFSLLTTGTSFDPLDIAAKSGSADPIVGIMALHRELWLIGQLTSEVWIGTGAADFYFQQVQGAYIDHGTAAQYSIANMDVVGFWIMQDKQGNGMVVKGANYDIVEVSTPRIVEEFKSYSTLEDAIGFCFQQSDHAFYCLTFPTANKTWLLDVKSGFWSEWAWTDANGNLNRHRANCCMFAYGVNLIGDWENGNLLKLDPHVYTDQDQPITRIRTFPHMMNNFNRISYKSFDADVTVGTFDPASEINPLISLSWSNNRGVSYGNAITQSLGPGGDYPTVVSWNRLGQARDRIFKLETSVDCQVTLNGAFIDSVVARS